MEKVGFVLLDNILMIIFTVLDCLKLISMLMKSSSEAIQPNIKTLY